MNPFETPNGIRQQTGNLPPEHDRILEMLFSLYSELFYHDGYGTLKVEMRFLKKGQKEILVACGKEYRFVVDYPGTYGQAPS
jgi:hypothetical protein